MGQEKALPWKNWEVVKLIGKGTYGDVYEIRKENTQYAARAALKFTYRLMSRKGENWNPKGFHWHRIYRKRRRILLQRLILWNL